jgi:hypothetical protein
MTIATLLLVSACKGRQGQSHLRLVNKGGKTLQCDVIAGTTSYQVRTGEHIARLKLAPGESADLTPKAGSYTLFPSEYMYQGAKGVAFYPFRLKAGRTLTITLDGISRPTFSGSAWVLDYKASSGPR